MKFSKQGIVNRSVGAVYNKYIDNFGLEFLFNSALSESTILKIDKYKAARKTRRSLKFKGTEYFLIEEISKKHKYSNIEISLVETNMPIKRYKKVFNFSKVDKNVTKINYALNYNVKFSIKSLLKKNATTVDKILCNENIIKEFKSYVEDGIIFNEGTIIYN